MSPIKFLIGGLSSAGAMDTIVYTHLCRAMAISYLFTCIVYYSHKKWVKVLFLAIGCMLFGLNIFLWLVFHKIISPQIITLIGETNYTEASEFLSTFLLRGKGLISLFILAITISIIIYVEKKKNFLQIKNATCFCILSAIILLSSAVGFYHFNVYYQIFKSKTVDDCQIGDIFPFDALTATIYSLNAIRTTNNEMNYAINVAEVEKGGIITEKDSLHIILIIGESYIKSHSQVYGYSLPTTPNLKREEDNGNLFLTLAQKIFTFLTT